MGDEQGWGAVLPAASVAQAWESFALNLFIRMPGFVTALSDENQQTDFQSGGRSLPGNAAQILPGLRLLGGR